MEKIQPISIIASTNLAAPASGFDGGDVSEATVLAVAELMATGADTDGPEAGGTLTVNSVAFESYDYCIHDGNLTITDTSDMADFFTATEDTRSAWLIVKGNLTVNAEATLRPGVRKLFTCIHATGTLTLDGTVSMTARGANHSGFTPSGPLLIAAGDWGDGVGTVSNPVVPVAGGAGGAAQDTVNTSDPGVAGTGGGTGGGASGARRSSGTSGAGAAGSMFAGGPGGGGTNTASPQAGSGVANGGAGGDGASGGSVTNSRSAGGGGGNPGGAGAIGTSHEDTIGEDGESGCAGLLIGIADIIAGSGTASANGPKGGDASTAAVGSQRSAGGGGAGGGHVTLVAKTSDSSTVAAQANAGAGGTATGANAASGASGGLGTARILEPAA